MAVTSFLRDVWSFKIQKALELATKLEANCTHEHEGEVEFAKSVKILSVGEPTVAKYTDAGINVEEMNDSDVILNIDQATYFAFYVDDIKKAQSVPGLDSEYQRRAVHKLAVARDTYVANLIKNAENVTVVTNKTEAALKAGIDNAIVALRERNFDEDGVIELGAAEYNLFKNYLITTSTNNPELIRRGQVGMYDTFPVIMSNNLAKDETHRYCDIRSKKAIAFVGQINEVESMRVEKFFKTMIRGLDVFGSKIIDEDRIQVVKVPLVATA